MSGSKFNMAKKLHAVQEDLMIEEIQEFTLEYLLPLIMKACSKQKLMFWFNFIEDACVLNLRDVTHDNYELNIRYHYGTFDNPENIKIETLKNAFILTEKSVELEKASSAKRDEPLNIVSGDKPVPSHIRQAIQKLEAKGVPITVKGIKNHLPLNEMSNNSRIKCNAYLKRMEASE